MLLVEVQPSARRWIRATGMHAGKRTEKADAATDPGYRSGVSEPPGALLTSVKPDSYFNAMIDM